MYRISSNEMLTTCSELNGMNGFLTRIATSRLSLKELFVSDQLSRRTAIEEFKFFNGFYVFAEQQ